MSAKLLLLLRHEWRLSLRQFKGLGWMLFSIGLLFVMSVVGALLIPKLPHLLELDFSGNLPALLTASGGMLFFLSVLMSVSMSQSVQILFERSDMDLLLSSPLETRVVLFSRALWIALSGFLTVAWVLVPASILAVALLGIRMLGVIPTAIGLAFLAAGMGLSLTLGLVRWLGTRRARTVAQVLGVLFGAVFYLVSQFWRFINLENLPWLKGLIDWLNALEPQSWVFLPTKALWFDPLGMVAVFVLGLTAFLGSVQLTQRAFLRGVTSSVQGGAVKPPRQTAPFAKTFWHNIFRKEWRLILRDPMLISQTLLQFLYLLPLLLPLLSNRRNSTNLLESLGTYPIIVTAAIMLGGSLSQNITQIMVSAEDAPELLRMSPTSSRQLRTNKLLAALVPIWCLFVPLIVWRGILEPRHFLILLGFAAVTILGSLMIFWSVKPHQRSDLRRQQKQQNWLLSLALLFLMVSWTAVFILPLFVPIWWALIPLFTGCLIPSITYLMSDGGAQLGY